MRKEGHDRFIQVIHGHCARAKNVLWGKVYGCETIDNLPNFFSPALNNDELRIYFTS